MTSLKKMTDEELEQERDHRNAAHTKENAEYWAVHELERKAWQKYNVSVYAVEDVRVEINRRNKRLRKEMKPFHTFTRSQTKDHWPLLSSECSCGDGWFGKAQTGYGNYSARMDLLAEMELEHLKDVRDNENQYTNKEGEG